MCLDYFLLIPLDYNFSVQFKPCIRYQNWSPINASYAHSFTILVYERILFSKNYFDNFSTWAGEFILFSYSSIFSKSTALTSLLLEEYSHCFPLVCIVFAPTWESFFRSLDTSWVLTFFYQNCWSEFTNINMADLAMFQEFIMMIPLWFWCQRSIKRDERFCFNIVLS